MFRYMYIHVVLFLGLAVSIVHGFGNSCDDIDHQACVAMGMQNANLCDEPVLAKSACPSYCHSCPVTCYNCNVSTHDVSSCNTVTCNRDEVCMKESVQTGNGNIHILKCGSKTLCNQHKTGSLTCCADDLCNKPTHLSTVRTTTSVPITSISQTPVHTPRPTTPVHTPRPTTRVYTSSPTTPVYTPRPTTPLYTPRPTTPLLPVCARDIILMIDQSDNVLSDKVNLRNNLADMIGLMKIGGGADETRVAMLTFDSTVHEHWNLNGYNDKTSLLQAIRSLSVTPSNGKATDNSATGVYLTTRTDFFKPGNRLNIPDVVMIITGSVDPPGLSKQQAMLLQLHSLYPNVIVVGIGNVLGKHRNLLASFGHVDSLHQGEVLQYDFVKSYLMNLICT